eukprot:5939652-Amphidinium_carterae.1
MVALTWLACWEDIAWVRAHMWHDLMPTSARGLSAQRKLLKYALELLSFQCEVIPALSFEPREVLDVRIVQ